MPQDDTYQTCVAHKQGGNSLEIGSGGDITIESGGTIMGMSGGVFSASEAFDFFLDSETFFTDRLRNALMGKGAWSIIVGSTGETISETMGGAPNLGGAPNATAPPITPSRMGYIVFSLANQDGYSARLHSANSGEELCIILRGEAGDGVSLILRFSTDPSDAALLDIAGVSVIGTTGKTLSSLLLWASADSRAFVRMIGVDDGCWAIIDIGESTGLGTTVTERVET